MVGTLQQYTRTVLPIAALVLAAPVIGFLVVQSPMLSIVPIVVLVLIVVGAHLVNEKTVRAAAYAVCAAVIMYPAFLPRRTGESVAFGGAFTARAQVQLVIVLALALAAAWLWLSTPGSFAALWRKPVSHFTLYSGVVVVSLLYTPDLSWAMYAVVKLLQAFLVVAVLATLVRTTDHLRQLLNVVLAATGVVLAVYLFDVYSGNAAPDNVGRPATAWIHANGATIVTYVFAVIMAARFFTAPSWRAARNAGLLTCFGMLVGLIAGGKTALVGVLIALPITLLVLVIKQRRRFKLSRVVLVAAALVGVLGYVATMDVGIAAHLRAYTSDQNRNVTDLTGRVPVWTTAIQGALEQPVLGHGYMSTFAIGLQGRVWTAAQAHNTFIQTFFDLGMVGVFAVVLIYAGAWWRVLRLVLGGDPATERWRISVQMLAALIVLSVDSMAETPFGGIFEIQTMLFILVIFAIHQTAYLRDPA